MTCDPAIKQFLIRLDAQQKFIIQDLDETHLLVSDNCAPFLQKHIDEHHDENTYVKPAKGVGSGR